MPASRAPAASTTSPPPGARTRDENSSRWQIFDTTSAPLDGLVRFNDTVQLWNTYHNRGGFPDTNDVSTATGARYDVDTSAYSNRANANVAFWKVLRPQP
ncbi:hypothetical protein [Streptomyces sanglieri]|uniref:hypothetical protein n=1 Tax=Streptomyces sanglieri TaxID=193460 RepID=UPI003524C879